MESMYYDPIGRASFGGRIMGTRSLVGIVCCAMVLSSSAWAATVEPGQGNLLISQGQGFQPVNSRIDANVGDSVMVGPGGTATVVYDDGCTVNVQPGGVTTVAPLSPCASGSYAQDNNNYAGALIVGAGVLGVAGFAIYEGTRSSSNASPASP